MRRRAIRAQGFTLLEAAVAMAILSLSLMAIFDLNSGAIRMHAYTKRVTVATLLARSKMTDIEQQLYDKGFNADDEDDGGDFSEEGWPTYKWRVRILAPRTDGISPEQVISAVFGIPLGGPGDKAVGGDLSSMLGGLLGGASTTGGSGSPPGGMGDLSSMLGGLLGGGGGLPGGAGGAAGGGGGGLMAMMGPMFSTQFQQMVDQITKTVREVHLTVSWKEGKNTETVDLVTHVVSPGPGGDRNGVVMGGQSLASAQGNTPTGPMVDAVTGAPVPNPTPNPNGSGFINPATGNQAIPAPAGGAQTNPFLNNAPRTANPTPQPFPSINFGNGIGKPNGKAGF